MICGLVFTFDVLSRLKGIETLFLFLFLFLLPSCLNVPSRLKGMETILFFGSSVRPDSSCLNVPSRLKGMETSRRFAITARDLGFFRCAFPFEGNRNNISAKLCTSYPPFDALSRLKGMETTEPSQSQAWCDTFDALSRLKSIETFRNSPATSESRMTQKNADFQTSVCPVLTALFGVLHGKIKKD